MKHLRRIFLIINFKTLFVAGLAVLSTFLCQRYELTADFPLTLIATAVIFPIVFSIGGAYKRREAALREYGSLKAHGRALYFATRDWLESPDQEVLQKAKDLLAQFFSSCRKFFTEPLKKMAENEEKIYQIFSQLSSYIKKDLRGKGLASGEVSRCNQFLSKMMISFENIKHIYQYRTPRTLRAFSDFFILTLPILYGPYFAELGKEATHGLQYIMPILFATILVSLDNIQDHLENPFDQIGEDDVTINVEKFIQRLDLK